MGRRHSYPTQSAEKGPRTDALETKKTGGEPPVENYWLPEQGSNLQHLG